MEGSFLAPAVSDDAPSHPVCVLLQKYPYYNDDGKSCFDGGDNATTAHAVTSAGRAVKVTFRLASAPSISLFCFHDYTKENNDDKVVAEVISSAKDLVLFRLTSRERFNLYEYLVYQVACHRGNTLPTLRSIQSIHPGTSYPAILPCDDDEGEFLIADLSVTPAHGHYVLDVYSSKTDKWVTWPLQLQSPPVFTEHQPPNKVMALGGGAVGWVNLWLGILVCDLDEHPVLRFIPLPRPRTNLCQVDDLHNLVRDVTCCDGIIKFVEMDRRFKKVCPTGSNANKTMMDDDLDGEGIIYDSELLLEEADPSCPMGYAIISQGWKIRRCHRHISWDYWRKAHVVDSDDIEIDNPMYSMVLPLPKDYDTQRLALNNLTEVSYPTLSARGDDVVYLWSTTYGGWVVGVDLGKKTVEVVKEINMDNFKHPVVSCAFSNI